SRRCRRPHELWRQHRRSLSPSRHLHRQDPQRRQTGRSADPATDKGRVGYQPKDRKGARSHHPAIAVDTRGRGDPVMDRRAFIGSVAIGLLGVPIVARAQQPAMPVIGFLGSASPARWSPFVAAFRKGLNEAGYIDGQNVAIEFRLPAMAAELAQRRVTVIVAAGGTAAALAARKASATIPIVFSGGDDAVAQGPVVSLGRPGGTVTGGTLSGSAL